MVVVLVVPAALSLAVSTAALMVEMTVEGRFLVELNQSAH